MRICPSRSAAPYPPSHQLSDDILPFATCAGSDASHLRKKSPYSGASFSTTLPHLGAISNTCQSAVTSCAFPPTGSLHASATSQRGWKNARTGVFRFRNFARSPILLKIINHESDASEFDQAAFFSFLFAIQVPSETLQLRRAYSSDNLLAFSPQPDKALIGVSSVGGELSSLLNSRGVRVSPMVVSYGCPVSATWARSTLPAFSPSTVSGQLSAGAWHRASRSSARLTWATLTAC